MSVHLLGKTSCKPLPLRVSIPTSADVFGILKVKRKLTAADKTSTIHSAPDPTLLQRKYLSSIISELQSRKFVVEHDLFIKYKNGLPIILKYYQTNTLMTCINCQNTRGIKTKLDLFIQNFDLYYKNINVLTETWVSKGIIDAELFTN